MFCHRGYCVLQLEIVGMSCTIGGLCLGGKLHVCSTVGSRGTVGNRGYVL